jgi:glycosyltransferase involved in cell wall biosynthesis
MNGNGRFRLIYHGALVERYGVDLLVQAVEIARPRIPGISLILQGAGQYQQELAEMIERLDLAEHVQLNGYNIHVTELPKLIAQADAGVVPNRNDLFTDELLPTKLLEYVALNVPVIAARTRGISSYFDERMVEFFTPGDAHSLAESIFCLYSNQNRRLTLKESASEFNRMHSWAEVSAGYVAVVDRLSVRR